jgi:hypothetical protein
MDFFRRNRDFILLALLFVLVAAVAGVLLREIPQFRSEKARSPQVYISGLKKVAELATVDYRAVAEVQSQEIPNDIRGKLGAKETIVMLVYGDVKVGFDLSQLGPDSIWQEDGKVQLHLPAPKILSTSVDFEKTHVVLYRKSLLVKHNPELEGQALADAKKKLNKAAVDAGALDLARAYGKLFFENYLRSLGFTEVRVIVD